MSQTPKLKDQKDIFKDIPKDIQNMSFEQAMSELEATVSQLEGGQVSLDQSVSVYTRGTQLKKYCDFKLSEAEAQIKKLIVHKDGSISQEEFEG